MTAISDATVKLLSGSDLEYGEAREVMDSIMSGGCSPVSIASYLTALESKGETVDEIAASAFEMRAHALRLPGEHTDALEIVGTGGDRSGSFNISTTSAFVIAGCGVEVAKHGNRAMSSRSGAADVLEALGARLDIEPDDSARILKECGFAFMFAQKYHPAMKYVAPVRRELGFRTVFNILGPLTNPAFAGNQFTGVFSGSLVPRIAEVLDLIGVRNAMVVYGTDGMDEMSVSAETECCELRSGTRDTYSVAPEDFGIKRSPHDAILGGGPEENASITRSVLSGAKGARRDIVLLNSAAGLYTCRKASSIAEGIEMAANSIDSGEAMRRLDQFVKLTGEAHVDT